MAKISLAAFALAVPMVIRLSAAPVPQERWKEFDRTNFVIGGHACFVTRPEISAPGKPWVWRTSFPDYHPEVDVELLKHGWHVAFIDCVDMLGSDAALNLYDQFYDQVRQRFGLAERPALEAVSRGGLPAYRYAARHPERIACIYADTPVMDLKSWPLGASDAKKQVADALKHYGFANEAELRAFRGNPVDAAILEPIARARIPLRHLVSLSDQVVPPEQNTFEARRLLAQWGHTMEVVTVAEGTAQSRGHHFPMTAAFDSARFILRYSDVKPGGRDCFEVRDGLNNSRVKFTGSKNGRVAFLGGSITANSGWRDATMRDLQQRFPETQFDFISAGIPSLGSVPHAFRLEQDILAHGPVDLIFVEAAVNDHNYDNLTNRFELALRGMEGVVRHLRMANPATDVVLLHFIHDQHLKTYAEEKQPYTITAHEQVATRYGCPSLDLSREVYERIQAGQFTWAGGIGSVHPSPYGQQVYANGIQRLLDACGTGPDAAARDHLLPEALDPFNYCRGHFGDIHSARLIKDFTLDPEWKPTDGKKGRRGFVNVPALVATTPGAEFEFMFTGSAAGLLITSGPDAGIIEFSVDGGPWRSMDTHTIWSRSLHLPWALMLDDTLTPGTHAVRVRLTGQRPNSALRVQKLLEN